MSASWRRRALPRAHVDFTARHVHGQHVKEGIFSCSKHKARFIWCNSKRENMASKSLGDLAVDGLLLGLAAGAMMVAFLLVAGMLDGVAPAAVLARFGLPGSATAVTGLLGHLAVSAVLGAGVGRAVWEPAAACGAAGVAAGHGLWAGALCRGGALCRQRDWVGRVCAVATAGGPRVVWGDVGFAQRAGDPLSDLLEMSLMAALYVHEAGDSGAPPIVFLHGGGLSGRMWQPQLDALTDFHCLAPDLPEHGRSGSVPFTLPGAAAAVAAI